MSWFSTEGKCPHHVIRSEVGYIRNLEAIPFAHKAGEKELERYLSLCEALLEKNGFSTESSSPLSRSHLLALAEKGFVDPDAAECRQVSVFFNQPCNLAVTLGGIDLLNIRAVVGGKAVLEAQSISLEAEEMLDRELDFAYSTDFGYLSPIPHRCGSGELFSALVFLPAARYFGEISAIRQLCSSHGAFICSLSQSSDTPCDLFTVTYTPHRLCDHRSDARGFEMLLDSLISREKLLEEQLFSSSANQLCDKALRALGTMLYAARLEEDELLSFTSSIRLCLANGDGKLPMSLISLNRILAEGLNCSVADENPSASSQDDLDVLRASTVKAILSADASRS